MTTRIDGGQGAPLHVAIDRTETGTASEGGQAAKRPARTDRIEVSERAALLNAAVQAASQAPDVRADRVDAARKALAAGTVGADAGALADALIDHMMDDQG